MSDIPISAQIRAVLDHVLEFEGKVAHVGSNGWTGSHLATLRAVIATLEGVQNGDGALAERERIVTLLREMTPDDLMRLVQHLLPRGQTERILRALASHITNEGEGGDNA